MKVKTASKEFSIEEIKSLIIDGGDIHVSNIAKKLQVEKITDVYDLIRNDPEKTLMIYNRFWVCLRPAKEVTDRTERVSNKTLIPLIKLAAQNDDLDELIKLREANPDIYASSMKYVGKRVVEKIKSLESADLSE